MNNNVNTNWRGGKQRQTRALVHAPCDDATVAVIDVEHVRFVIRAARDAGAKPRRVVEHHAGVARAQHSREHLLVASVLIDELVLEQGQLCGGRRQLTVEL